MAKTIHCSKKDFFEVIKKILISLRPGQWYKNLIVFAGIIFSRNLFDLIKFSKITIAFFIFCFLSGSIYLINDVTDIKEDRSHPYKSKRPIAEGSLKVKWALLAATIFSISSLLSAFYLNPLFGWVAFSYFFLLCLYSLIFKKIIVIDIITVALGFFLRMTAGMVLINVNIPYLLLIFLELSALFLILNKRRNDLILIGSNVNRCHFKIGHYSIEFINRFIIITILAIVIVYFSYTIWPADKDISVARLRYTTPFVFCAVFRYLHLMNKEGERPTYLKVVRKDKFLIANVALWIFSTFAILYIRI